MEEIGAGAANLSVGDVVAPSSAACKNTAKVLGADIDGDAARKFPRGAGMDADAAPGRLARDAPTKEDFPMKELTLYAEKTGAIDRAQLKEALQSSLDLEGLKRVLLLPPDITRFYSRAGEIANIYYHLLKDTCEVDIIPTLGSHMPMTEDECREMFGDIPFDRFIAHNWRTDVVKIGEVPAEFVREVSEGLVDEKIDVELNRRLLDNYDLILSIGQVVPHEVVGMANYSKNVFVGVGGASMISASHMLGAFYGLEKLMGKDFSPVRKVFDYAEERFLKALPLWYVLTVTTAPENEIRQHALFIGRDRGGFEKAVALAQEKNITFVDRPLKKVVVYMDPKEFRSTWVGNKSIYRTRMAIADGGELIVLAPGVSHFGEDPQNDVLIRKYGYCGRERAIALCRANDDLANNLSVAAHIIHGSSDGRFNVTYCTKLLTEEEVRNANFDYMPFDEAVKIYDPALLRDGWNTMPDGEEIYYIPNPALGLWADRSRY